MRNIVRVFAAVAFLLIAMPVANAQETTTPTQLGVTTPYVGVSIKPGDSASFSVDVSGPPGSRVALSTAGLPEGWTAAIQGGGYDLSEVLLDDTGHVTVTLAVDVPAGTAEGEYALALVAAGAGATERLDLSISVTATAGGEVTLTTDFPELQGSSDSSFSYNLTLDNGTPQDIQFGLTADGPAGWQTTIRPSGESQASTVTVAGGRSSTISVTVDPPATAAAGTYVVTARAEGSGADVAVDLTVHITGSYAMDLVTANQVLNLDVNAGEPATLDLIVVNSGSAPLQGVRLTATQPSGWDVTFNTDTVDLIAPGESAPITATVTPADDSINGDYVLTFTASVTETRASADIRTTVKTSGLWGLVGVGIIVVALVGLTLVFRRYGRH